MAAFVDILAVASGNAGAVGAVMKVGDAAAAAARVAAVTVEEYRSWHPKSWTVVGLLAAVTKINGVVEALAAAVARPRRPPSSPRGMTVTPKMGAAAVEVV